MAKKVSWTLSRKTKRPPNWVLEQEGVSTKADLVKKYGTKPRRFEKAEPPAIRAVA